MTITMANSLLLASLCLVLIKNPITSFAGASELPIPGWNLLDKFLLHTIPKLAGQIPNDEKGNAEELKDFVLSDKEDWSLNLLTMEELITAAGFKQENYKAVSDDGYITTLVRIVNPLVDRKLLKWPPVLMMHGGTIDPTAYLFASTKKHHPEKYPRDESDGPITSYNRSLAFVLCNAGHDVWLAETRGSNERNMDHINLRSITALFDQKAKDKNMTTGEKLQEVSEAWNYWSFSQDEIIQHEVRSYIDKICQVIHSNGIDKKCKVNLFSFSLSTPLALGFLSTRPDYAAEKIHRLVIMAPTFYKDGLSPATSWILAKVCPLVPNTVGIMLVYDLVFLEIRKLLILPGHWKKFRYSIVKSFITLLMGPSAKYRTLLELNVLYHVMRVVGFKQGKQMCQQMKANRLQKYDFGVAKNLHVYNSPEPPEYDLSNLLIKPPLIVVATNDALASPAAVSRLINVMNPKPYKVIKAPEFNHLDLVAGVENDKYVNLPILKFLDETLDPTEQPGYQKLDGSQDSGASIQALNKSSKQKNNKGKNELPNNED